MTRMESEAAGCYTATMRCTWLSLALASLLVPSSFGADVVVKVTDDDSLRAALAQARPGTHIQIAPGRYAPGIHVAGVAGTQQNPIVIEGADEQNPPLFEGGRQAWQLTDCVHLVLRNIVVRGQTINGINVDDGGTFDTPAHHVVLENLHVAEIGPQGNHDAIKLSGVTDFTVRDCSLEGWGGQAVDMVGCHRGLIDRCKFRGKDGFSQHTGPQTKGGSSRIVIRRCLFVDAAGRGCNLGGSTGPAYFRPKGALYEAKDITVEGCAFVGCEAPIAYVGVDGAIVRYNTFFRPRKWVLRILQETTQPGFVPCRNGRFERNIVVFRHADVRTFANVGSRTSPETFRFSNNLWFCEDRPSASKPELPTPETNGLYGIDPQLTDPARNRFRPKNPQAIDFGAFAWGPANHSDE